MRLLRNSGISALLLLVSSSALLNPEPQQQAKEQELRCPPAPARCRFDGPGRIPGYRQFYVDDEPLNLKHEENDLFTLNCGNKVSLETASMPRFSQTLVINVSLVDCDVPQGTYFDVFAKINITDLKDLSLHWSWPTSTQSAKMVIGGQHFAGLQGIHTLTVSSGDRSPQLLSDALLPLGQLRELFAINVRFNFPLPPGNRIEMLTIQGGEPVGLPYLKECSQLWWLSIFMWNVASIPTNLLAGCLQLETVLLTDLPVSKLPERLLAEAVSLKSLEIAHCTRLTEFFPQFFRNITQLQDLDLSKNGLINLPSGIFQSLTKLKKLNLSGNELGLGVILHLAPMVMLKSLSLAENPIGDFCYNYRAQYDDNIKKTIEAISEVEAGLKDMPKFSQSTGFLEEMYRAQILIQQLPALEQLDLESTGAKQLCAPYWSTMPALWVIDYSNNDITEITYADVVVVRSHDWLVKLHGNPIGAVRFNQRDYDAVLQDDTPVNVKMNKMLIDSALDCDCRSYWFARAFQVRPAFVPAKNLRCKRGELHSVSPDTMICQREESGCAAGCTCYDRVRDNATLANCTAGTLERLPNLTRLAELRAPRNRIITLHDDDLPDTLVYLDVRENLISRVEDEAVTMLFKTGLRRKVLLGGNQLECDCRATSLVNAIQIHSDQVLDYNNVTCADGQSLRNVSSGLQCFLEHLPPVAGTLAVLVLFALGVTAFYYQREVKVFMYARGWCQCWVHEDDIDSDKRYDVFVSFAHGDEEFVVDVLIPRLESEPLALDVCVHYRDWIIGDWIPTQITRSVEESRRTIAVVSRNFLRSTWACAEFRTAHALAMSEGRVRLVIILLEEVANDERLDDELRAYLLTNTYVKWGDPRFWEKLLYALPRRSRRRHEQAEQRKRAEREEQVGRSERAQIVPKREQPVPPERETFEMAVLVERRGEEP